MTLGWPTILHVDDDPGDRELVQHAFKSLQVKLNIQWVEDGQAATDYLSGVGIYGNRESFPLPELMLLDLKMPRKNGFEVLEWVRHEDSLKWLPVVVFTASNAPRDIKRCLEIGANSVVVKPTDYGHLVSCLKDVHHYWFEINRQPEV